MDEYNQNRSYENDFENVIKRDTVIERRETRNKTLLYTGLGLLGLLIIALIFILAADKDSHYEIGVKYIQSKQYNAALTELQYVTPSDAEYVMAQSHINFINGAKAYDIADHNTAKVYLSKVDERDPFYKEARLMIDQILAQERTKALEEQLAQNQTGKDTSTQQPVTTIVIPPVVKNSNGTSNNNNNGNNNNNNTGSDEQISKKYVSSLSSYASQFNNVYQSAYTASPEAKRNYVSNLNSIVSKVNSLNYNASEKNAAVLELKGLMTKWMNRRIDFINRLVADNLVNENNYSRALKEEGDKLYNMTMRQLNKVKSLYNI